MSEGRRGGGGESRGESTAGLREGLSVRRRHKEGEYVRVDEREWCRQGDLQDRNRDGEIDD